MNDDERTEPRILVVDLETTGLNARVHSIHQIGAVWLTGGVGEFSMDCRIWPGAAIDPEALSISGRTLEQITDPSLPLEGDAVKALLDWADVECGPGGKLLMLLAGLNPSFDRAFLHEAQLRPSSPKVMARRFPHRVLDLHSLAISYAIGRGEPVPSRGYSTDEIYSVLDMQPEPRPHVAIVGARMEAEALRVLLGLPELAEAGALNPLNCVP